MPSGTADTPLQKVRLSAAQAHILLTDTATRAQGFVLLDDTVRLAQRCGLSHQLQAIGRSAWTRYLNPDDNLRQKGFHD